MGECLLFCGEERCKEKGAVRGAKGREKEKEEEREGKKRRNFLNSLGEAVELLHHAGPAQARNLFKTPSISKRIARTGGAAAEEAEAAAAEGDNAVVAVEVWVERCREKRFCKGGACAAAAELEPEPLLPVIVLPLPRPVDVDVFEPLRPTPLAASPYIHAPVIFMKEREKTRLSNSENRRNRQSFVLLKFFFFLLKFSTFLLFSSLPFPSPSLPFAFPHDGRHGASNYRLLTPLWRASSPLASSALPRPSKSSRAPLQNSNNSNSQIAASRASSMASTSAFAGRRSATAAAPRRAVFVRATEDEKKLDFQPSRRSVSSRWSWCF